MQRNVSPVPNHTINTCRFPYTGGFFDVAFQVLHIFRGIRPSYQSSTSSLPAFAVLFNDTAEFTLCYDLHSRFHPFGLLYPTLQTRCFYYTTLGGWLQGFLAITLTGLSPVSMVQLCWTHATKEDQQMLIFKFYVHLFFYCILGWKPLLRTVSYFDKNQHYWNFR